MTGLYIHIPFCVKKCAYCDFLSFRADEETTEQYVKALTEEIQLLEPAALDSVFIGGGTPSLLSPAQLDAIFYSVLKRFSLSDGAEITIEVNPGTVDREKARAVSRIANRVSVGVQSLSGDVLCAIGRIHDAAQAFDTIDMLRAAGIDNINADMMYGLPYQLQEEYADGLSRIAALTDHISAYSLILEENTPLYYSVEKNHVRLPTDDETESMHIITQDILAASGFERYETSNYARPGRQCTHNINYWEYGDYRACGLGAVAQKQYDGYTLRTLNTSRMTPYLNILKLRCMPIDDVERVSGTERLFEHYMMGLRQTRGAVYVHGAYDSFFADRLTKGVFELDSGNPQRIRFTPEWYDCANQVLSEMTGFY